VSRALSPLGRRALRAGLRHRRALVAVLTAGAVATGVQALAAPGPATAAVVAAARDVPWGARLTAADLVRVALPVSAVPDGTVADEAVALGRLVAGPVRRGEPITDVRLVGPALLAGAPAGADLVATPVRIADPESADLLRAGDTVDVLAAAEGVAATVVAPGVRVLAVPRPGGETAGPSVLADGALVVLATSPAVAARLARAATTSRLSITVRPA
jgi:Flp pilus assembly protein CpaB